MPSDLVDWLRKATPYFEESKYAPLATAGMVRSAADRIEALDAQLATVTRERDEAKEGWAGAEERLGDCIDAAKEAWAKHGGREIALGHQRARAETAERERDEVRAVVVAATAVLANWDAHLLDGPEQQKEAEWGKYWSPDAAMVNAEPMAGLRAALRSLNGGS